MRRKTLYGIIAILVAGVLVLVAGIGSSWFTNGDIKTWFNSWGKDKQEIVQPENPDNSNKPDNSDKGKPDNSDKPELPNVDGKTAESLFQVTPIATSNKLMRMTAVASLPENYGLSTQAENSVYTLTAFIDPFETTDQTVSWAMEWANASSSWASGKNVDDYVTLTIPEEGAQTVTLKAKQAFGERIRVIATSNSNPDATAYCVLDYAKRVADFSGIVGSDLTIANDRVTYNCSATSGFLESGSNLSMFASLNGGVGTFDDTFQVKLSYAPEVAFLNAVWGLNTVEYSVSSEQTLKTGAGTFGANISGGKFGYGRYFLLTGIGTTTETSQFMAWPAFAANTAVQYLMQNPNTAIGTITVQATGTYSSCTKTYFVYADTASLTVVAQTLGLSDSNIIM